MRRRLALAALALLTASACKTGPTKHDLYMEGMKIEGDAEDTVCKMHGGADPTQPAVLSGDQVQKCLEQTNLAIEKYEAAAAAGLEDLDFKKVHQKALDRRKRLQDMLTQVRSMEREAM